MIMSRIPGAQLAQLARLATSLSDSAKQDLQALGALVQHAGAFGRDDPPAAFRQLFAAAGAHYGLPPLLLAAVSAELTGFHPDTDREDAVGLMGIRRAFAIGRHTATVDQLLERDPAAVEAVRTNVYTAAELLKGSVRTHGLAAGLVDYLPPQPHGRTPDVLAGHVAGTFALYLARASEAGTHLSQLAADADADRA